MKRFIAAVVVLGQLGAARRASAAEPGAEELLFENIPEIRLASKVPQRASEAAAIVSVVTAREIKDMGARDLAEVLRAVAGLDVIASPITSGFMLGVRGIFSSAGSNNKIKLMVDGYEQRESLTGGAFFYINSIPIDNIDHIEIIRGPGSALYGGNAFAGVINIITKDANLGTSLKTMADSFGNVKTSGGAVSRRGDFASSFYVEYVNKNGPNLRIERDGANTNFDALARGIGYTQPVGAAPGNTRPQPDSFVFRPQLSYKDFYFKGQYIGTWGPMPISQALALNSGDHVISEAIQSEFGYKRALGESANVSARAYFDHNHIFGQWEDLFPPQTTAFLNALFAGVPGNKPYPAGEGVKGEPGYNNDNSGAEVSADREVYEGVKLVGGGLYDHMRQFDVVEPVNSNISGKAVTVGGVSYLPLQYFGSTFNVQPYVPWMKNIATRDNVAGYLEGIFDLKKLLGTSRHCETLSLTGGVRYDYYDDVGQSANPRLGLVYAPVPPLSFKVLFGTAFRAPNFSELYTSNNPVFIGNPQLRPERLSTVETLANYDFSDKMRATATYFITNIRDLIQTQAGGTPSQNIGKVRSQGVELEFRGAYAAKSYAYVNGTYQNVKNITHATIQGTTPGGQSVQFTQADYNPGGVPAWLANFGINRDWSGHYNANTYINMVGQRWRSGERSFVVNPANGFTDGSLKYVDSRNPVKSRALWNIALTLHDFAWAPQAQLQLGLYNAFNDVHRDPDNSNAVPNDLPQPGRSFAASFAYKFGTPQNIVHARRENEASIPIN